MLVLLFPYFLRVYRRYSYYNLNLIAVFCLIKFYSNLVSSILQLIQQYFILKLVDIIIVL